MCLKSACRKTSAISLALCFLLLKSSFAGAQNYIFDLEHRGVEEGLPTDGLLEIAQDREGYMWFSSNSAIFRYDGVTFKSWPHHNLDLLMPMVPNFAFDDAGRVWYANRTNTLAGDSCGVINPASGKVLSMREASGNRFGLADLQFVTNPDSSTLVAVTHAGTYHLLKEGKWSELITFTDNFRPSMVCRPAQEGGYWIVNDIELLRINQRQIKERYEIPMQSPSRVSNLEMVDGIPRLDITGRKVNRNYILQEDSLVPYAPPGSTPETLHRIMLEHKDFTIFATLDSLLITDRSKARLKGYPITALCDLGKGFFARSLMDRQGNLWITSSLGLTKIDIRQNPFKIHLPRSRQPGIAVLDGQLTIHEPPTDSIINPHPGYKGPANMVLSYYVDDADRIWMGHIRPYISVHDPSSSTTTHIHLNEGHWSEYVYQNPTTGHYWIATNQGLYVLECSQPGLENCQMGRSILPDLGKPILTRDFHRNEEGIWVATQEGVFLVDPETEKWVEHFSTKNGWPAQIIFSMHEDDKGIFWLASMDGGLLRWNRTTNEIRQFAEENGFPSNEVSTVYEDNFQTIWLASRSGLIAFDKNDYSTRLYRSQDGLSHTQHGPLAHTQTEDGTIYLGGHRGITSFHPRDLHQLENRPPMPLHLAKLEVLEGDQDDFTDRTAAFQSKQKIILQPNDRILKVQVALLDFNNRTDNQYAYRLSGKSDQWIQTRENQFTLLNLSYGDHILEVKARGSSGAWTGPNLEISIEVLKPVYLRTWFILSVAFLAVFLIILLVSYRLRSLKKIQRRLENEVKKRTEQIRSDKKVIEAQANELRELDVAKSRFFTNITHEFRTPLTLVIGPVEQELEEDLPSRNKVRLKGILKNARNLLVLINQLLDLSKLESGSMDLEISRGEIVRYTYNLVKQFKPLAEQKQIKISFAPEIKEWETYWDAEKWDRTVYNLISNAIKFTPAGGQVNIVLQRVREGTHESIILAVQDTGLGIEADQIDRIFNRFYQVQGSGTRLQGGTGVGLSLVKELVEFQKGEIKVESVVGEGTVFTVQLPVFKPTSISIDEIGDSTEAGLDEVPLLTAESRDSTLVPDKSGTATGKGDRLKLLIIEDDKELRTFIRSCLDPKVYAIHEAPDGQAGLQIALEIVPDLILSDVMMPKMDGFEVTKAIREHLATSHIPLILLTAKAALESRLEGLRRGADAYLTKPFSPRELTLRIEKLIELRKKLQKRYQKVPRELNVSNSEVEALEIAQPEDQFMSDLMAHLSANIKKGNLSPAEIGKHFALSRSQLYRKVQSLTDKTIRELIRELRCEQALLLIKENSLSLAEISYEVGFSSPSYFSTAFKKHFGKAPSEMVEKP